jgi:DNA-binding MarR family transcriptional regulator
MFARVADRAGWTFITSHGALLLEVARDSDATVKQLADRAGVTERQAHRVLADLVGESYIVRERVGRKNRYRINDAAPMRHRSVAHRTIGEMLAVLQGP